MPVWLELSIRVLAVVVAFLTLPLIVGQAEHKVMAHMQGRLGPMYAGAYHGWAQLIADGVKFVQKESVTPAAADGPVFRLAPFVALLPYLAVLLVIPLGPHGLVAQPLDIGLLMVLAVVGIGVVSVLMAAWASANKYSLLGGVRAAAQLLGYELPLVLAAASVAMAAGTLSLSGIVEAWRPWWLLWQAPAAVIFFTAGT
jgi:NADH-quinone oxidoreductase subunit H